jgi:hypothetical protein
LLKITSQIPAFAAASLQSTWLFGVDNTNPLKINHKPTRATKIATRVGFYLHAPTQPPQPMVEKIQERGV